ncbi:MAG TPA: YwbE family protein [Solidesulfovibrio magneticus]|nr:YwbE family protein [Solidesulfovibrio magneticus]
MSDPTRRENIRPGQRVAIVLKKDQRTGTLTEGVVRDLLTKAPIHTRGIKVRLIDGQVGRVHRILD